MSDIALRWIERDDPLYIQERRLRFWVLRQPLGMPEGSEENPHEARCRHCVALEAGRVVGCVLALPDGDSPSVKLLQMAIAPDQRARGIGSLLVRELERRARDEGAHEVYMHARISAQGFYERLGYAPVGEVFDEVGLPHVKMTRHI